MPTVSDLLTKDGAFVTAQIGIRGSQLQFLRRSGSPIPQPVTIRAMLDSGAEVTCLDSAVTAQLGFAPTSTVPANVPALMGWTASLLFDVSVTILHPSGQRRANLVVPDLPVLELSLANLGYQGLIGRDILDLCLFVRDGPGNRFTLAW